LWGLAVSFACEEGLGDELDDRVHGMIWKLVSKPVRVPNCKTTSFCHTVPSRNHSAIFFP
jgi:hypothetical protein